MGNIKLRVKFAPFFDAYSNSAADVGPSAIVAGAAASWIAEKVVFNKNTTVNRIGYTLGVLTNNVSFFVGITTSLGPHGLYPYTDDGVPGSATSLGYSVISNILTHSTIGSAAAGGTFRVASLVNDFTFEKDVPYWLAVHPTAFISGNFNFWGTATDTSLFRGHQTAIRRIGNTVLFSGTAVNNFLTPGYYSGSGKTVYYPMGHYAWNDSFNSTAAEGIINSNWFLHKLIPYYEFGGRFELNDIGSQQLELSYVQYGTLYPVDSNIEYTCKLLDHRLDVVGIAITERPNVASATLTDRGIFTFYFVPKVKINPDYPYYLTFVATGGTACSSVYSVVARSGGRDMKSQSSHYLDAVQRTSSTSSFEEDQLYFGDYQPYTPSIVLGISDFIPMRRGGGN